MRKGQLPKKECPVCHRPFEWRAKWRLNWENVVYCSKRCSSRRNESRRSESRSAR
ncbi:MAG: DUF2256 domain-containing protein [Halioglobus sp.]